MEENKLFITYLQNTADVCDKLAEFAEHNAVMSRFDKNEINNLKSFFTEWGASISFCKDVCDGRVDVPFVLQGIYMLMLEQGYGVSGTASQFFIHARTFIKDKITSKQSHKIAFGHTQRVVPIYEPHSFEDAIDEMFYGAQCPECNNWRIHEGQNPRTKVWQCHCYACDTWFELVRFSLPGQKDKMMFAADFTVLSSADNNTVGVDLAR